MTGRRHVRLLITVCPRERGFVRLPLAPGGKARRLDAAAIFRHLARLVRERGLVDRVQIEAACAGGCAGAGPNVSVASYPCARPGHRPDHVAIAWKTYVSSLASLRSLRTILDENL